MDPQMSERALPLSMPNDIDDTETDESNNTSKYNNFQSSDSDTPTASETSTCENSEDWNRKITTDEESRTRDQLSVAFLRTFLPWMQKSSKAIPGRGPSQGVNKIGGTLALIQYPRPPNLPVKTAAEERYHRRQYHIILEEARKREIREEYERQQYQEEQLKREERLATDSIIWYTHILPKFESLRDTKKVRNLWWCGLPPSIRGKIWKLGIANDLNISSSQYDIYLERIDDNAADEYLMAIKLDVSRTFPNLGVFQEDGPLFETLQDLLAAYTIYKSEIGYVQGMSFIGAILTLNMEPNDAFICFANLLHNPCHRAAFTLNQKQMSVYYKVFSNTLEHKIPKIHLHFCANGLSPDLYLLDWLYTIYAKAMPLDVACRIWDVFIRDGDEFLFRTALGILHMFQDELLTMDFVRCAQFLNKLPENLQASVLFDNIRQMKPGIGMRSFNEMIFQLS